MALVSSSPTAVPAPAPDGDAPATNKPPAAPGGDPPAVQPPAAPVAPGAPSQKPPPGPGRAATLNDARHRLPDPRNKPNASMGKPSAGTEPPTGRNVNIVRLFR